MKIKEILKEPYILYPLLTGLYLVIPNLAIPAFAQVFVDRVVIGHSLSKDTSIVVGMLIAILGIGCLSFLQRVVLSRLRMRFATRISSKTFWHMLRLPISFLEQRQSGEIAQRLSLVDSISENLTGNLAVTIINVLFAIVFGIVILFYSVVIGLSAIFLVCICLFIMNNIYTKENSYVQYREDLRRSMAYSLGGLQNIETIKASGMETRFFTRWAGYYTNLVNSLSKVSRRDVFVAMLSPLLSSLVTLLLIGIGVWEILNSPLTIGMFVAVQMYLSNFISPFMQLLGFHQTIQLLKIDLQHLEEISNQSIDRVFSVSEEESQSKTKLKGDISVQNLFFGYDHEHPILKNISFELDSGKVFALVGATGCGKSTLAKLIAGLYTQWSGEILFDEMPNDKLPRSVIVSSLSLVEQEPFLFNGTVMENLTMLDRTVNQEEVFRAAKDSCIHEDILSRPGGYDMEIKENGSNFSGGQKQRLEIARALIKNPRIVILDEATSVLEEEMEKEIIKNIQRRGCTILLITHRKSIIESCDKVLSLENGGVLRKL